MPVHYNTALTSLVEEVVRSEGLKSSYTNIEQPISTIVSPWPSALVVPWQTKNSLQDIQLTRSG